MSKWRSIKDLSAALFYFSAVLICVTIYFFDTDENGIQRYRREEW